MWLLKTISLVFLLLFLLECNTLLGVKENHAPIITSWSSSVRVIAGKENRYNFVVEDEDNDDIHLELNKSIPFISVIKTTLVLNPSSRDTGEYFLSVSAVDSKGASTSKDLHITVLDSNYCFAPFTLNTTWEYLYTYSFTSSGYVNRTSGTKKVKLVKISDDTMTFRIADSLVGSITVRGNVDSTGVRVDSTAVKDSIAIYNETYVKGVDTTCLWIPPRHCMPVESLFFSGESIMYRRYGIGLFGRSIYDLNIGLTSHTEGHSGNSARFMTEMTLLRKEVESK